MSTAERLRVAAGLVCLVLAAGCAQPAKPVDGRFGLGRAADPAAVARLDLDVAPDGSGLPNGSGSVPRGASVFAGACQRCHGAAVRLDPKRWLYATTLFDYVGRAMPPDRVDRLSADDLYAVSAYLLYANGRIDAATIVDRETLPRITLGDPNDFTR